MIKIAIVGTGGIANLHAHNYAKIPGCKVVAGVDVEPKRLAEFCQRHKVKEQYASVRELLRNCDFAAASVCTPDGLHVPCALPLVQAGKHVLCEKPIAPTAKEGQKLAAAAKKAKVMNLLQFSYRQNPALYKAHELVKSGKLGELRHFEAHYLQSWLTSKGWGDFRTTPAWLWRLSKAHGSSGVLGDIGVHIVDLTTFVAAAAVKRVNAELKVFPKTRVKNNRVKEYVFDANDSAYLRLELAGGALGTVAASRWATGQMNSLWLTLHGTKGALRVDLDKDGKTIEVCLGKDVDRAAWRTLRCPAVPTMFKRFVTAIKTGKADTPDFARGVEVQKVLDAAFKSDAAKKTITLRGK